MATNAQMFNSINTRIAELSELVWELAGRVRDLAQKKDGEREVELMHWRRSRRLQQRTIEERRRELERRYGPPRGAMIKRTDQPCPCGSDHNALQVSRIVGEEQVLTAEAACPREMWLFRSSQFRHREDFEGALRFQREHPLEEFLHAKTVPSKY